MALILKLNRLLFNIHYEFLEHLDFESIFMFV